MILADYRCLSAIRVAASPKADIDVYNKLITTFTSLISEHEANQKASATPANEPGYRIA